MLPWPFVLIEIRDRVYAKIGKHHHHRTYKEHKACRECANYRARYDAAFMEIWEELKLPHVNELNKRR